MTSEAWREVPGWGGRYLVSNQGRVQSVRTLRSGAVTKRILSPRPGAKGHLRVVLHEGERRQESNVHVLVLEAFVGPRPPGMVACHWNDDPADNRAENLRWGTHTDNMNDRVRNGRHAMAAKTHCLRGHPLSGENLYINPGAGGRVCRTCRAERKRAWRARRSSLSHNNTKEATHA